MATTLSMHIEVSAHPFVYAFAEEHDTLGKQKSYLKTVSTEKLHTAIMIINSHGDRGALSNSVKGLLEDELQRRIH